jgi:deazaflavin-dependent oxidoreductase (nitroreductase family)
MKGSVAMSVAQPVSSQPQRRAMLGVTRVFNRFTMLLAGTRLLPLYGMLVHRGRRSGKTFRTPVVVRPTSDGFIIPMPWGQGTDWYRNVRAAGECVVRWKGRAYPLVQPEVIDAATAAAAFSPVQQAGMARFGIKECLRLHHRA